MFRRVNSVDGKIIQQQQQQSIIIVVVVAIPSFSLSCGRLQPVCCICSFENICSSRSIFASPGAGPFDVPKRPRMLIPRIRLRLELEAPIHLQPHMARQISNVPELVRFPLQDRDYNRARTNQQPACRSEKPDQEL